MTLAGLDSRIEKLWTAESDVIQGASRDLVSRNDQRRFRDYTVLVKDRFTRTPPKVFVLDMAERGGGGKPGRVTDKVGPDTSSRSLLAIVKTKALPPSEVFS